MKLLAYFALTAVGILLGLWLGVWVLFVGGIVSIIEAAKANPVDAFQFAWGIIKIAIAAPVGWLAYFIFSTIGGAIAAGD